MMCHSKYFVKLILWCFVLNISIQITCTQRTTTPFSLNPATIGPQKSKDCVTRNGTKGICVPEKFCTADYRIPFYGVIDDSELREKTQCKEFEWCCVLPKEEDSGEETEPPPTRKDKNDTTIADGPTSTTSACTRVESTCPWCVTLHKGTLNDVYETGLYCMGSMIGRKVVLTSATCILAARDITLWVQAPTSENPKQKYAVRYTKKHPNFNSGTHEYDYGFVVLEEEVTWGQNKRGGACLGLDTAVDGDCVGFGFDGNDQIVATLLKSKSGGCSSSGDTVDVACSRKHVREEYCIITAGSPVSCKGSGDVTGVARSSCSNDAALVGSLSLSKDWITAELKKLNVSPNDYVVKRV